MIVCVGLATRDTIYAVPHHPAPDERVVATERVVAGGGPAATAAVAIARLGVDARFVGVIEGDLDGVEVVRMPGRMVESTILVAGDTRAIVTRTRSRSTSRPSCWTTPIGCTSTTSATTPFRLVTKCHFPSTAGIPSPASTSSASTSTRRRRRATTAGVPS